MKRSLYTTAAALLLTAALPLAHARSAQQPSAPPAPASTPKPVPPAKPPVDRGERAFNANCSRCHQPPETLNPRITGTVIRHMRVRANLSAQDEQDILRFLNP
jgi:cytochrome c5